MIIGINDFKEICDKTGYNGARGVLFFDKDFEVYFNLSYNDWQFEFISVRFGGVLKEVTDHLTIAEFKKQFDFNTQTLIRGGVIYHLYKIELRGA